MSDTSGGPGWWQASDGKWYPPDATSASAPQPGAGIPPSPIGPGAGDLDAKGFLRSLFDFQFDHFVTPKLLRFFYAFYVIVLSLVAVLFLLGALASGDGGTAVAGLIFIPIFYLIYVIATRVSFELIAALFRIAEDLRAIRRSKGA